jgi:2-enoate reductase
MLAAGKLEDARPCILCNEGCAGNLSYARPARCAINPAVGREATWNLKPDSQKKKVLVVGGGIAGMEAARTAAIKGHEVVLLEKTDRLGGHLLEASASAFKKPIKDLLDWAKRQIENSTVEVRLNTEAIPELIQQEKANVLIIAVGSEYVAPKTEGPATSSVTGRDVLLDRVKLGDKVVIIGGGMIGCETALHVTEEEKRHVTIVDMFDDILLDQEPTHRTVLKERLTAAGVEICTGLRITQITAEAVEGEDRKWTIHSIPADTVVACTGLKPKHDVVQLLKGLAPETYVIGDCANGTKVYDAFEHAWRSVLAI